jgi:HupE / UreJ protein
MIRAFLAMLLLATLFCGVWATNTMAHSASRSFSTWTEDGNTITGIYSVDQVQATLLIPLQDQAKNLNALLSGHLAATLHVFQQQTPCPASVPVVLPARSGALQILLRFTCPNPVLEAGWSLRNDAFFKFASTHIHIAQISNDTEAREFIFTNSQRRHVMRAANANSSERNENNGFWGNFTTYIKLGISHILQGFDHLSFVTALIILARSYKGVALLVTGFTLGHSITLSLAALGLIQPDGGAIEALIGFSIAFVAMEVLIVPGSRDWFSITFYTAMLFSVFAGLALLGKGTLSPLIWMGLAVFVYSYGKVITSTQLALRASLALTTAFGLVHGAGFATVLAEAGLPQGQKIAALGGFNIGVEIGQLLVIALWLAGFALSRKIVGVQQTRVGQTAIGAIVLSLGIYWFASRTFL